MTESWAKFALIVLAGVIGNGIGAWNIRTISQGRYLATAILTFCAATINMTVVREIAREVSGVYILAFAVGSTLGITSSILVDKTLSRLMAERKVWKACMELSAKRVIETEARHSPASGHVYPWIED